MERHTTASRMARVLAVLLAGHLVTLSPCHLVTAAEPPFALDTASGKPIRGPLEELRADWSARVGGETAGDVVALRRAGTPLPPAPRGEHVVFANGDRLPGKVLALEGQRLNVRFGTQALPVPLSALAVVWLAAPEGPEAEDADRLIRRLAAESRTRDVVLLRNGDTAQGILTGLDAKVVRLDDGKGELQVERGKVAAVALNTELVTTLRPKGAYGRVVLRDGGRLSLASATWAAGKPLTGATLFKADVTLPAEDVVAVYVHQGPAVYLSDLKPRRAEHASYGGDAWPYVADGSAGRGDLTLDGSTYDKGLGTHSQTRLTYDLAGRYRRFEALVGLDPVAGRRGSARVRVLVDGKPLGLDREITARAGAVPVSVDVAGAKELTLAVEFGAGGPVQDHVNRADARLIK
jgi:hypothetical protein